MALNRYVSLTKSLNKYKKNLAFCFLDGKIFANSLISFSTDWHPIYILIQVQNEHEFKQKNTDMGCQLLIEYAYLNGYFKVNIQFTIEGSTWVNCTYLPVQTKWSFDILSFT